MRNTKHYATIKQAIQSDHFQNPIEKSLKETNSIPPTKIRGRSFFWFDICTSIKGGRVKQA
jgi:hypothetical protein